MFLALSEDVLVVTDADRSTGIVSTGKRGGTGLVVSAGYVSVLEKLLMQDGGESPSVKEAVNVLVETGTFERREGDAREAAEKILLGTPGLRFSEKASRQGRPDMDDAKEGFAELSGQATWHPDGRLTRRKIGDHSVIFVLGKESLSNQIRPVRGIEIAGILDQGPVLGAASSGCGACGACGVCGGCILCAEVNYAVAAASATAAVAVTAAGAAFTIDPRRVRDDFNIHAFRETQIDSLERLQGAIKKIQPE